MKSDARAPKTIDAYLAPLPRTTRAALQSLRKLIRAAAPGVEEQISYQMPAFRLDGKWLVYFAAAKNHCALYGLSETHPGELADYDTSGRGTIRFTPESPLPAALVRKLLAHRIATNAATADKNPAPTKKPAPPTDAKAKQKASKPARSGR